MSYEDDTVEGDDHKTSGIFSCIWSSLNIIFVSFVIIVMYNYCWGGKKNETDQSSVKYNVVGVEKNNEKKKTTRP